MLHEKNDTKFWIRFRKFGTLDSCSSKKGDSGNAVVIYYFLLEFWTKFLMIKLELLIAYNFIAQVIIEYWHGYNMISIRPEDKLKSFKSYYESKGVYLEDIFGIS